MKRTIIFLLLLCSANSFATKFPMPANGSVWGFVNPAPNGDEGYIKQFRFKSDTVINKLTYQTWENSGIITRNDSNKVYIWENQKERLLYDFNLVTGDSFTIEGYDKSYTYKVTSADSITMKNGQRRKSIDLEYKDDIKSYSYHWVEGIGDLFGGFLYLQPGMQVETHGLVCFCDNSGLVYQSWKDVTCENVESIGTVSSPETFLSESVLFLNGKVQVDPKLEFASIHLFDDAGKQLLQTTQSEFSVLDFPAGHYYVVINLKDGKTISRAMVIK